MRSLLLALVATCLTAALPQSADALCYYHGELYAKTTVQQEFADSTWVVRARVISGDNHWQDEGASWTLYTLKLITTYKGHPPQRFKLFTLRDSGGFYLDKGTHPDVARDYLLFLDPADRDGNLKATEARDANAVNYSCGQSKPWNLVTSPEQHHLASLSRISR